MFGYIKPCVPLLTVAEYEAYKGVYCGLCREMGKVTGQLSKMTLSYDFAFLAFFRMLVEKLPTKFDKGTCIAHPFKKKTFAESNPVLTFCAYASAMLTAEKTKDDIADEKGAKLLAAKALYPIERHTVSKMPNTFSTLAENVSSYLEKLAELEKNKIPSIDLPAEIFGNLLGEICSFAYKGADQRIAKEIGGGLGKIIYVLDAADDIEKDIKDGKYNPIALVYENPLEPYCGNGGKERAVLRSDIKETLQTAVHLELKRAKAAFSLLDTEGCAIYSNIIMNILEYGISAETEKILAREDRREHPLKHNV